MTVGTSVIGIVVAGYAFSERSIELDNWPALLGICLFIAGVAALFFGTLMLWAPVLPDVPWGERLAPPIEVRERLSRIKETVLSILRAVLRRLRVADKRVFSVKSRRAQRILEFLKILIYVAAALLKWIIHLPKEVFGLTKESRFRFGCTLLGLMAEVFGVILLIMGATTA